MAVLEVAATMAGSHGVHPWVFPTATTHSGVHGDRINRRRRVATIKNSYNSHGGRERR